MDEDVMKDIDVHDVVILISMKAHAIFQRAILCSLIMN